jgi:hypothetical protein
MSKPSEAAQRRHVREKGVIDHLADKVFEPMAEEEHATQDATTSTGLPVEEQVRKEWDPRKEGLPTFFR